MTAKTMDEILDRAFERVGIKVDQRRPFSAGISEQSKTLLKRIDQIESCAKQGLTRAQIVEATGIPKGTVIRIVKDCGIQVACGRKSRKQKSPLTFEGLAGQGFGYEDIAQRLGVPVSEARCKWDELRTSGILDDLYTGWKLS